MSAPSSPTLCACGCGETVSTCIGDFAVLATACAAQWDCPLSVLFGKSRASRAILARHLAMAVVRAITVASYDGIGRYFGVDAGTVMHACRKMEAAPPISRQAKIFRALVAKFNPEGAAS